MRIVGNDPTLSRQITATASGAISAAGKALIVNTDGTVSFAETTSATGTAVVFDSSSIGLESSIVYDTNVDRIVISYQDGGNSYYGTAIVGTVSGTSISFGTPVVFKSANSRNFDSSFDTNANKVVITYKDSNPGRAIVGTIDSSDNSISFGSEATYDSTKGESGHIAYDVNAQKHLITYYDDDEDGRAIVGTVSGTDITFGSSAEFETADTREPNVIYDVNAQKHLIFYNQYLSGGSDTPAKAKVATISGTSVSFGSIATISTNVVDNLAGAYDVNAQKSVIIYRDQTSSTTKARVATISGTDVSFGTEAEFDNVQSTMGDGTYDAGLQKTVFTFRDGSTTHGSFKNATISGTDVTFSTEQKFASSNTFYTSVIYDPDSGKNIVAYSDAGDSYKGKAVVINSFSPVTLTTENFIGTSAHAAADGAKVLVNTQGTVDENIPQQPVDASVTTSVDFESGRVLDTGIVYDSNVDRFLIVSRDRDNSDYGTGVVASLSGTTLSFGTPVVFESATTRGITPVFDTNTNKIVITYKDVGNSERGTAVVATIDSSDNSVSYGSPVIYHTSESSGSFRSAAFVPATAVNSDDSANSIVVAFKDGGDSGRGKAVVGVVSGAGNTSTTWGSVATFNTGSTDQHLTVVNDTNAKRLLIAYRDTGNSNYGTAVVASVNSTDSSISFGSETVFNSSNTDEICGVFDPDTNKIILCFQDAGDSNKSKSVVATISGTSVSFGSIVEVNTGSSYNNSVVYDTTANKAVVSMRDDTNSRGISFTGTVSGTDISYDSGTVFQGSTGGALDATVSAFDPDNSKIVIAYNLSNGKAVVHSPEANGDLTAGQTYFVQSDGSFKTSADSPSVTAGTALSATKLLVKG